MAFFRQYLFAKDGSEPWILRKLERKYLEGFEMWCWTRMEKIKWSEKVTNEQVLECRGEKRALLSSILRGKANEIGRILRRNCLRHKENIEFSNKKGAQF